MSMKFSIFPGFGALNSIPVFQSFRQGAEKLGHTVVEHDLSADVYVIWSVLWHGRMFNNQEIWNHAKKLKKNLIILEVGCLKRGTTWKVGIDHINANGFFANKENLDYQRSKKLGIFLKNWKNSGENILICGQHTKSEQWKELPDAEIWLRTLVENIKKYSNRPIVFRPHPRDHNWCENFKNLGIVIKIPQKISGTYDSFDHENDFNNAWCVINPSSNTGVQAAIGGIPVFTEKSSLAYPVSMKNLEKIESPIQPDREQWFEELCHTEWTLEEIAAGIPLSRLLEQKG